jgi:hypothetical protein
MLRKDERDASEREDRELERDPSRGRKPPGRPWRGKESPQDRDRERRRDRHRDGNGDPVQPATGVRERGERRQLEPELQEEIRGSQRRAIRLAYAMWPKKLPLAPRRRASCLSASAEAPSRRPASASASAPRSTIVSM